MKLQRKALRPYSYKARTQLSFSMAIVLVLIVTLFSAYAWFSYIMRSETADDEYTVALSILQLQDKTELDMDEIMTMSTTEDIHLRRVERSQIMLNDTEMNQLQNRTILAFFGSSGSVPVTFVMTNSGIVEISSAKQGVLFFAYFQRTVLITLLCASLFALVSFFSSARIVRPITQLTAATRKVSEGDFSMKLPEDSDDELSDLMHSFNRMTDALERTSVQQKDFIASVSHEFKTPIASIKGYARLLQMPGLDEETRQEYIRMISQESDRLSRLSDTLLRLSALQQQTDPAQLETFRLDEQLRQVILRLEPVWSQRNIEFDLELDEVTICSDSDLLNQVWVNLIQNAMKFSPDGSLISVSVRKAQHGKAAICAITDHGIGMTEQTMARIFDRFYQGDKSRSREGVGLGLNLVQRILTIVGGRIDVKSKPGEGSTFTVYLPIQHTAHT